jgi:glycogen operon protein
MLATLLVSQGTPLLLAGDEFGNSQLGNNNAYAQDNETSWLDWSLLDEDPDFVAQARTLIRLRREEPLLRSVHYLHGESEIAWRTPAGKKMAANDWRDAQAFSLLLGNGELVVLINGSGADAAFSLPGEDYEVLFATEGSLAADAAETVLPGLSVAVLRQPGVRKTATARSASES